jgi:hypothetical protein
MQFLVFFLVGIVGKPQKVGSLYAPAEPLHIVVEEKFSTIWRFFLTF